MQNNDINTGFIDRPFVKKYINFFCAAVDIELTRTKNCDIEEAYRQLCENIVSFSKLWSSSKGIRPVKYYEDILSYFFNQKNNIPAHVCYWLLCCYDYTVPIVDGSIKQTDTYIALQKLYIHHYRWLKRDESQNIKYAHMERRKICKMYRSGIYAATFKLYGKSFDDIVCSQDMEDLKTMLSFLFKKQAFNSFDEYDVLAIGYILGRIQGRTEMRNGT